MDDIPSDDEDVPHVMDGLLGKIGIRRSSAVVEDVEDDETDEEQIYKFTGFQKPDRLEMLGVFLSFGAVIGLSLAAGLTTVYDWVL